MPTLFITRGLPASGKSTWAREHLASAPKGSTVIVCRDDLRLMLHDGVWSKTNEKATMNARDVLIRLNLLNGLDVVVSDTNLDEKTFNHLSDIAAQVEADVEVVDFRDVPLHVCIERDALRPNPVGKKIINQLHLRHLSKPYSPPEYDPSLPDAILLDLDGTIARMHGRSPYDYTKVDTDKVDVTVRRIVQNEHAAGTKVIVLSGRRADCIDLSIKWLNDNDTPFDEIHQREPGDETRTDYLVKHEMLEKFVFGKYNILYSLDDRDQVVRLYRSLGIKVLQTEPGDF